MVQFFGDAADELLQHLTTIPEFANAYADWWVEQPFFEREEYAIPGLALYVSINSREMSTLGDGKTQRVRALVSVYMEYRSNADSHAGADNRGHFLAHMPLVKKLHAALHGWKGTNFQNSLERVSWEYMTGLERLGVLLRMDYNTTFLDATAVPEKQMATIQDVKVKSTEIVLPDGSKS